MNEAQRQAYLQAMDIQTYFPRVELTGAKPSPEYDFPVESQSAMESNPQDESLQLKPGSPLGSNKDGAVERTRELTQDLREQLAPVSKARTSGQDPRPVKQESAQQTVSEITESTQRTENTDAAAEDELRFTLRYFKINDTLAVIDEVPHLRPNSSSADDVTLLKAILAALGVDSSSTSFHSEEFVWPLDMGLSMKNDPAEEAKKALSGFMQMRQEIDQFSNLLIFAAQIDTLLLPTEEGEQQRDFKSAPNAAASSYFLTLTSSLNSMLAYPSLKREVWEHLQPLRKRLSESTRGES